MWLTFALGSAVFAGSAIVLAKAGVKHVNPTAAAALQAIVVLLFAWGMVFFVGSQAGVYSIGRRTLLFLLLSGVSTGLSLFFCFRSLQFGTANQVTPVGQLSVVLTLLVGMLRFHEPFSWVTIIAMVLMLLGMILMAADAKRSGWLLPAILSAVFAAISSFLSRIGLAGVERYLNQALQISVAFILLWLIVLLSGKARQVGKVPLRNAIFLGLSGAAAGAACLCLYHALRLGVDSHVALVSPLFLVITVLLARIFLLEKLSGRAFGGLLLLMSGLWLPMLL